MLKYGNNPEFRDILQEFSQFMGHHFQNVADLKKAEEEAKKKAEEEAMKNDPVYQTIQTDNQVKEYLQDAEVIKILEKLRYEGGLDLHAVLMEKPLLGQKLMYLIQKGVLNT